MKFLKSFVSLALSMSIIICGSLGSFAFTPDSNQLIEQRNIALVEYLKSNDGGNLDSVIEEFYGENPQYSIADTSLDLKSTTDYAPELQSSLLHNAPLLESTKTYNEIAIKSVQIDKNQKIDFYESGNFAIETLTLTPISKDESIKTMAFASPATYVNASNDRTKYGVALGQKLYSLHVESDFGYDGINAWISGSITGYYTRGFLSVWQVSNWSTSGDVINDGEYARATASGNFHYGFEVEGVGFVIQDIFEDLRVSVTRDGTVYKN